MKIIDAISRVDALYFNTFSVAEKIAWLSKVDWLIKRHILDTHEGPETDFRGYTPETDLQTELLAPVPYDEMYLPWLQAQMELALKEFDNYNASILTFNTEYEAFENYYNRTHMPKQHGKRFLF
jgi:hypothetical protein